jgi:DNA-binding Lrp family transcriptional regulator
MRMESISLQSLSATDRIILKAIESANARGMRITFSDLAQIVSKTNYNERQTSGTQYRVYYLIKNEFIKREEVEGRLANLVAILPGRVPYFSEDAT